MPDAEDATCEGDPDRDTCELCGEPRPPDSTVYLDGEWLALCPAYEDLGAAALPCDYPLADPTRAGRILPHGGTER